ncbi:MAG: hypothetical protein ACREJU_12165, partial [Nitrospiraceae bacterium]
WDHSGKRFGSTEKAHRELGFEIRTPFRNGIEQTIEWTRRNLDWIDACIRKHQEHMARETYQANVVKSGGCPSLSGDRSGAGASAGTSLQ